MNEKELCGEKMTGIFSLNVSISVSFPSVRVEEIAEEVGVKGRVEDDDEERDHVERAKRRQKRRKRERKRGRSRLFRTLPPPLISSSSPSTKFKLKLGKYLHIKKRYYFCKNLFTFKIEMVQIKEENRVNNNF